VQRRRAAARPRLSVVVPFHDSLAQLRTCLDSLLAQTYPNVSIVLVDDGSKDGAAEVAADYAARHWNVHLVRQERQGPGGARNAGVRAADGLYLAFCDADDTVPVDGYARMVEALEKTGSDMVVGSATLQSRGVHVEPLWARRSNPRRTLGTTLDQTPAIMGNLITGARVFRRSFWDHHRLRFAVPGDHSDVITLVEALTAAERIDILPAVVYRWCWREDGRTLLQRVLRDKGRLEDRLAQLHAAATVVAERGPATARTAFLVELFHTTIPELVRGAVARDDGYWETLSAGLRPLLSLLTDEELLQVPFEDRVMAWMCAHDRRPAAESFLEYAFDNQYGYPYRLVDGKAHVTFPAILDADDVSNLAGMPADFTLLSPAEIRFRARLTALRWTGPGQLAIEGAAFFEYVDDREGTSEVTLVLRSAASEQELRVAATPAPELDVNQWAARAHEDHTGAGFRCAIDVRELPSPTEGQVTWDIDVELRAGGRRHRGRFMSRQVGGSAGLLEPAVIDDDVQARPQWRNFDGLKLALRPGTAKPFDASRSTAPVRVSSVRAREGVLVLEGEADHDVELRLTGPRGSSEWVSAERSHGRIVAAIGLFDDEWGLGRTPLPMDVYALEARPAGSSRIMAVSPTVQLWRSLPTVIRDGDLHLLPQVTEESGLNIRLAAVEWRTSRPSFLRRRLRDEVYPAARQEPLLDVALFETFAGKATGDNPGALCQEMARRDGGPELVFSVIDRSIEVPDGARAVVRFSAEYFELLGRARYLLVNASLPYFFRKREGQLYFQTWHGSPLKRIAHDRPHLDFFNWHHRRQLLIARDGWDYLLSQSDFCTRSLCSAFRYDGAVMELGYPRNDVLSSPDADRIRADVRRRLGLRDHDRVILYAPTWRDNHRVGRVFNKVLYLDPEEIVSSVDNAVVLVRGHYNSMRAAEQRDPDKRIIDVTRYPDIGALYLAADALVTDYSSVFFDFAITDKPMVFLAPDLAEYRDDNRGFYLDYHETVPGPICLTTGEVVAALSGPDRFVDRRREFRQQYVPHDDGGASARVVDAILEWGRKQ
jgi:CDP-glycerol glycerophosphotransferase (TagB/SpsB family)